MCNADLNSMVFSAAKWNAVETEDGSILMVYGAIVLVLFKVTFDTFWARS